MAIEDWAASGMAALTGDVDGPPDFSRAPVLAEARAVLDRFVNLMAPTVQPERLSELQEWDAGQILTGRAALTGNRRGGRVSCGGGSRILEAKDGWVVLTLSRESDIELIPALFCVEDEIEDHWAVVESNVASISSAAFVERARLLGLPAARLGENDAVLATVRGRGTPLDTRLAKDLVVADLSSLWAGPLCGQLLKAAGACVVKVESPHRPDGSRQGNPDFFDWMNAGKLSVTADFATEPGLVRSLLSRADVVIEGSRPRTLRAHGLASDQLAPRPGQVWLRITAYGTEEPGSEWVGFGDDTAVAGGLVSWSPNGPVFCGDAIADPLTGLESAMLVAESLARGGGQLIDVSLAHVAARYSVIAGEGGGAGAYTTQVAEPRFRSRIGGRGPALGIHNAEIERIVRSADQ